MKTWQKILLVIIILLIGGVVYLYFTGKPDSPRGGGDQENPIFPFDTSNDGFFDNGEGTDDNEDDQSAFEAAPRLWQISDRPVAGSQWVTRGGATAIWYTHQENGHIFTSSPDDRQPHRLINTTIPQVETALITPDGDYVLYQYIDTDTGNIKTYKGAITRAESGEMPYQIDGSFLPDNLTTISLSPDGEELFFLQPGANRVVGVVHNLETSENRIVFESTANEWRSSWTAADEVTLFTKPATNTEGFAYKVNTDSGEMQKLAEGRGLLASLSSSEGYVFINSYTGGRYQGRIIASSSPNSTVLSPQTLVDKCSWAQQRDVMFCGVPGNFSTGDLVKNWYQGSLQFTDTLFILDPANQNQSNLFSSQQYEQGPFDIIAITTDPTFNFLTFQNKRTGQLWGFEL